MQKCIYKTFFSLNIDFLDKKKKKYFVIYVIITLPKQIHVESYFKNPIFTNRCVQIGV